MTFRIALLLLLFPVPGVAHAAPGDDLAKLVQVLEEDPSRSARRQAAWELAGMGPGAAAAVEALREALDSGDPVLAAVAAHALGQVGRAARPAVEDLVLLAASPGAKMPEFDEQARLSWATLTGTAWHWGVMSRAGHGGGEWCVFDEDPGGRRILTRLSVSNGLGTSRLVSLSYEEVELVGPFLWIGGEVQTCAVVDGYLVSGAVVRVAPRTIALSGWSHAGKPDHWRFELDRDLADLAPGVKGSYRGFRTEETPSRGADGLPRFGPQKPWSGKYEVTENHGTVVTLGPYRDPEGVTWNFWGGCFQWYPEARAEIREGGEFYHENRFPTPLDRLPGPVARTALGSIVPEADAAAFLTGLLDHPEPEVRSYARRTLRYLDPPGGPETARALIAGWGKIPPRETKNARATLVKLGAAAVPAILEALDTADGRLRRALVGVLGEMGEAAASACEALGRMVVAEDTDESLHGVVLRALGRIGPAAEGAVPALVEYVADANSRDCVAAVKTLRAIAPESPAVAPALLRLLRHRNRWIRAEAVDSLGRTAPGLTAELAPAVLHVLTSRFGNLRGAAARALSKMEGLPEEAVPALEALLDDPEDPVRTAAAGSLVRLAPEVERLVPALIALLDSARESTASDSAKLLGELGERALPAVPALARGLGHDHWWVRRASARTLAGLGLGAEEALPELVRALDDPERTVRGEATRALEVLAPVAPASAVPGLLRNLSGGDLTRIHASRALLAMGKRAVPALKKALEDPDERTREAAAQTLRLLDR